MDLKAKVKEFFKDKWNIAFLVLLLIAIIIRVRYRFSDSMWPDEALYVWYGYKLLHSPSYLFSTEFTHTISYFPSLLIAFFSIFTSSFAAGKITALLFGIAGIVFVYLLGKEMKDGFVGLVAAIFLTFNPIHWFYTNRVLLDAPLTAMFIITAYCLIKFDKHMGRKWALYLAAAMALTMYTKVTGILVIPIVGLYFLLSHQKNVLKLFKRRDFRWLIAGFVLMVAPLFIINLVNFGGLTVEGAGRYVSSDDTGANRLQPTTDFIFVTSWYVLPLALLGIIFALLYRKKEQYLLLSWFLGVYLFFTLLHPQSLDRYVLPGVVPLLLLAALSLDELRLLFDRISKKKLSKWLVVGVAILLVSPLYVLGNSLVYSRSDSYTGFKDAGTWLKENAEPEATIYTDSTRAIRVFSLKEDSDNNGELTGPAKTKQEFERQIAGEKLPVYLVVDVWEYIQPTWMFPLTQEKADYITSLGFQPVEIISKPYQTEQGLQNVPVVVIFKKSA